MWTRPILTVKTGCNLQSHLGTEREWYVGSGNLVPLINQCVSALKIRKLTLGWPMSYEDLTHVLDVQTANRGANGRKQAGVCLQKRSPSNNSKCSQPLIMFPNYVNILWK